MYCTGEPNNSATGLRSRSIIKGTLEFRLPLSMFIVLDRRPDR